MKRLALLVPILLLTAGCLEAGDDEGDAPAGGDDVPPQGPVEVRELEAGQQSAIQEPTRRVIESEAAFQAFWDELHANEMTPPEPPQVNFTEERVIGVVLGERKNACYAVRVTNATVEDDAMRVTITEFTPPPDMFCAQMISYPYHVVAVPAIGDEVTFEERQETLPQDGRG